MGCDERHGTCRLEGQTGKITFGGLSLLSLRKSEFDIDGSLSSQPEASYGRTTNLRPL